MLISLNNINFEFGAHTILEKASWHIYANERIGLIGPNGAGKSTVLKILVNEHSISAGEINKSKDLSIGYFHQNLQSDDLNESILKVAMGAYAEALKVKEKLDKLQIELEKEATDALIEKQADLLHKFEVAGGYEMEHITAEVLEGLGFTTADLSRPFAEFSGGWRMRVLLAKMILQKPDILLLDEPTNHLDLPSIEWIERYLQSYQGTIVIVSHDRYFLDRMVTKIVEVSNKKLNSYTGSYSNYEDEKSVRLEFQQREYDNQQVFIKQQERFVERFKAKASKATQAQSIVKKLERLDRIEAPAQQEKTIEFRFQFGVQPGKMISELNGISKSYGEIEILKEAKARIHRGDKIALIGANGKGKSTLLRILAGMEEIEGDLKPGHNVHESFYAQHQLEALSMEADILKELSTSGSKRTDLELRQLLGCFLFSGDDVFKKIRVLSGGEKARVALAKTIIQEANFLMLDEPTNHLDISSVASLVNALNNYEGTYIIVSHDRYFIQKTANTIWEIEDGKINMFDGTYDEYLRFKEKKAAENKKPKELKELKPAPKKAVKSGESYEERKALKRMKNKFNKLEKNLAEKESLLSTLEVALASPDVYANKEKFKETELAHANLEEEIIKLKKEYEEIFEKLLEHE